MNERQRRKGLILTIFNLLAMIETDKNKATVQKIRGLLNELLSMDED